MKIGVTGASSDFGSAMLRHLAGLDIDGIPLGRRRGERPFLIGAPLDPASFDGLEGVIHLAWDRTVHKSRPRIEDPNITSARELFTLCRGRDIPATFLSSTSARYPEYSLYGATKLRVEGVAAECGVQAMRAGLIWGGNWTPVLSSTQDLANMPAVRLSPRPSPILDHNHETHVMSRLLAAVRPGFRYDGVTVCTSPERVALSSILASMRRAKRGIPLIVPSRLTSLAARKARDFLPLATSMLDSLALLNMPADKQEFDPDYPQQWGALAMQSWLRKMTHDDAD